MADSTRRTFSLLGVFAAVLVALFVVGVAAGSGSGCSCGTRASWRARLLGSEAVAPGQLDGCTRVLGRFTINGSCELTIAASDQRSRRLRVEAADAMALHLVIDADGRRITTRGELEAGETKDLFVGKDGQRIRLRCRSGTTCRARVE